MIIEATVKDIRMLLDLAAADGTDQPHTEVHQQKRALLARRVPRRLRDPYELLLDMGCLPALAAIERGACSGCHIRLPTMVESRARQAPAIHRCPRCRRMLYAPQLVAADSPRSVR